MTGALLAAALLLPSAALAGSPRAHGGIRSQEPGDTADGLKILAEELGGLEAARTGDAARNEAAMVVLLIPVERWGDLAAWIKTKDPGASVARAASAPEAKLDGLLAERARLLRAADDLDAMASEMPLSAAAVQQDLDANIAALRKRAEGRWLAFVARIGVPGQDARSMMSDAARLGVKDDLLRPLVAKLEDRLPSEDGYADRLISAEARSLAGRRPQGAAASLRRELAENAKFFDERPELRRSAQDALKRWDKPAPKTKR